MGIYKGGKDNKTFLPSSVSSVPEQATTHLIVKIHKIYSNDDLQYPYEL
jgi:hypothetical protein